MRMRAQHVPEPVKHPLAGGMTVIVPMVVVVTRAFGVRLPIAHNT
jgi:hypothetical protein